MLRRLVHIRQVKVRDGGDIQVAVLGQDSRKYKKHVVLVHGIGGNYMSWLPFALPFLLDYTFVIPDLRGFGGSCDVEFSKPNDVLANFAEDLEDIISEILPDQAEKIILGGVSMGAFACMKYMQMTRGARVEKYLNVDQAPKAVNFGDAGMLGARAKYLLPNMTAIMHAVGNYVHTAKTTDDLPESLRYEFIDSLSDFIETAFHRPVERFVVGNVVRMKLTPVMEALSAHRYKSYFNCLNSYVNNDYDFRDMFKTCDVPVYMHIGLRSEMYPVEGQREIVRVAKNIAQVVEFDEGHALMYTSPIKFFSAFRNFLYRDN